MKKNNINQEESITTKRSGKDNFFRSAKEISYLALFVALLLGGQWLFSFVAGVEIVSVLSITYAFVFGIRRGMIAMTAFSLLRCFLFGFFINVIILYLIYYNFLAIVFGLLGKLLKNNKARIFIVVLSACICTSLFTLMDDIFSPLIYAYSARATKAYFLASLPVMGGQVLCVAITVFLLFIPLKNVFYKAGKLAGMVVRN